MAIIGINGYAGSGKDTVARVIQYLKCENVGKVSLQDAINDYGSHGWWLQYQSDWDIVKWAGKLKQIASILTGIPVEKFEDQEFKKTNMPPEWSTFYESDYPWEGEVYEIPLTVREFLQRLGTDGLRDKLHKNVWINALMSDYKEVTYKFEEDNKTVSSYPNWIIADTRFINEANAIKEKGGIVIRVERPGVDPANLHESETSLDNYDFDYVIVNDGSLEDLAEKVKVILEKEKLM